MGVFTFKPFFSKSVHHLLNQILAFGQLPSKMYHCNASEVHLDAFTHGPSALRDIEC